MDFEWQNFIENTNEWVEYLGDNIKIIDETFSKLWYKLDYVDDRAWRVYCAIDDSSNKLNIYWWISGVPKNKEITEKDILSALFDQNSDVRSDEATEQINKLLWTNLPTKFDDFDIDDLTWLTPYIKNYKAISSVEYNEVKNSLIHQIRRQTGVKLDNDFSFDWNITTMWSGLVLMIDWKWLKRNDDNFWKVKMINVNFNNNKVDIVK